MQRFFLGPGNLAATRRRRTCTYGDVANSRTQGDGTMAIALVTGHQYGHWTCNGNYTGTRWAHRLRRHAQPRACQRS